MQGAHTGSRAEQDTSPCPRVPTCAVELIRWESGWDTASPEKGRSRCYTGQEAVLVGSDSAWGRIIPHQTTPHLQASGSLHGEPPNLGFLLRAPTAAQKLVALLLTPLGAGPLRLGPGTLGALLQAGPPMTLARSLCSTEAVGFRGQGGNGCGGSQPGMPACIPCLSSPRAELQGLSGYHPPTGTSKSFVTGSPAAEEGPAPTGFVFSGAGLRSFPGEPAPQAAWRQLGVFLQGQPQPGPCTERSESTGPCRAHQGEP